MRNRSSIVLGLRLFVLQFLVFFVGFESLYAAENTVLDSSLATETNSADNWARKGRRQLIIGSSMLVLSPAVAAFGLGLYSKHILKVYAGEREPNSTFAYSGFVIAGAAIIPFAIAPFLVRAGRKNKEKAATENLALVPNVNFVSNTYGLKFQYRF